MIWLKVVLRYILGGFFVCVGILHFVVPDRFVRIMPPYLPWPDELVAISGGFEILLGLLLLVARTATWAGWGLIALLIAVFPANLHMALHTELFPEFPALALEIRLPFQAVLIAWAYWYTRPVATAPRADR